jgi:glycosyltransferase involved in cell wall biosynthesis
MGYIYLGGFPPPYGGVTIKNKLIFEETLTYLDIHQSKFYQSKSKFNKLIGLIREIIEKDNIFIIGLSNGSLIKLTVLFVVLLRKSLMKNAVVMVMGGTLDQKIKDSKRLVRYFSYYKMIYVETESMKLTMNKYGLNNVEIFPNCRKRRFTGSDNKNNIDGNIKCVYFSLISKEKGADIVIDAARILDKKKVNYEVDFYGHIEEEYAEEFEHAINNDRIKYKGIFKPKGQDDVYDKLKEYDILLFPTRWKNEGVPGVIVESKIAGITSIVSDINYNSEIVINNKTGVVLYENNSHYLSDAIEVLYNNKDLLKKLKLNALESSEKYYIDNYIHQLVSKITSKRG